jgi:hypothetical protein
MPAEPPLPPELRAVLFDMDATSRAFGSIGVR